MVDRLKRLCDGKHTNFRQVEIDLDFANGSLKKSNDKMQAWRLKALSDYFGVSMEYLLTGSETPQDALSPSERELLHLFRSLSSDGQSAALNVLQGLQSVPAYKKKETSGKVG